MEITAAWLPNQRELNALLESILLGLQLLQDAIHLCSTDKERKKAGVLEEHFDNTESETTYACHRVRQEVNACQIVLFANRTIAY